MNCKECKHWDNKLSEEDAKSDWYKDVKAETLGYCSLQSVLSKPDTYGFLITQEDFGCVLFEQKT